jgi:VanZ family protein
MTLPQPLFSTAARLLFCAALVFAVVMAVLPQPPQLPTDALGDKFHHVLAFAVLSALAAAGWPQASRWRTIERLSFLGALIEVVQAIPSLHRDCDIRDWVADTVAIMVVTGIAAWLAGHRNGAPAQQHCGD